MKRHIFREGTSSCPIFSSGSQGVPTLTTPLQAVSLERPNPLIGCVSRARLSILCNLWKSDCMVLITWFPSGYTPVGLDCLDALLSPCLLITRWQLVKAHGVTRNEPKIPVICYITRIYVKMHASIYRTYTSALTFKSTQTWAHTHTQITSTFLTKNQPYWLVIYENLHCLTIAESQTLPCNIYIVSKVGDHSRG